MLLHLKNRRLQAALIHMTVHLTRSAGLTMAGRCFWLKADSAVPVNALPCVKIGCTLALLWGWSMGVPCEGPLIHPGLSMPWT
jgi:hypothetical protein